MNQLRPRFLEWPRDQFSKGPVDSHEYLVPFVERQTSDQHAVRPARDSSFNLIDKFVETDGVPTNVIANETLDRG